MYYGLSSKHQLVELAQCVCEAIGYGTNGHGVRMLVETCAAETLLGKAKDNTLYGAGAGVSQVDKGTFVWLQEKFMKRSVASKILKEFNINLGLVQYNELDFSPLLSLIFCRLRYMTVSEKIPATQALRAEYWKKHYNSSLGKGTPQEYLERCDSSGVTALLASAK